MARNFCGKNIWQIVQNMPFGGLVKAWHLVDFTSAVEQVICYNIHIYCQNGDFFLTQKYRTVCQNSSVCHRQWYQCWSSQRCTQIIRIVFLTLTKQFFFYVSIKVFGNVMTSYAALDDELHAAV